LDVIKRNEEKEEKKSSSTPKKTSKSNDQNTNNDNRSEADTETFNDDTIDQSIASQSMNSINSTVDSSQQEEDDKSSTNSKKSASKSPIRSIVGIFKPKSSKSPQHLHPSSAAETGKLQKQQQDGGTDLKKAESTESLNTKEKRKRRGLFPFRSKSTNSLNKTKLKESKIEEEKEVQEIEPTNKGDNDNTDDDNDDISDLDDSQNLQNDDDDDGDDKNQTKKSDDLSLAKSYKEHLENDYEDEMIKDNEHTNNKSIKKVVKSTKSKIQFLNKFEIEFLLF
jgi:hypothetical protein